MALLHLEQVVTVLVMQHGGARHRPCGEVGGAVLRLQRRTRHQAGARVGRQFDTWASSRRLCGLIAPPDPVRVPANACVPYTARSCTRGMPGRSRAPSSAEHREQRQQGMRRSEIEQGGIRGDPLRPGRPAAR
ncbi:hypothetical protein [Rhodanobacter lindaniclasticus]